MLSVRKSCTFAPSYMYITQKIRQLVLLMLLLAAGTNVLAIKGHDSLVVEVDSILLRELTVTATCRPMSLRGDTLVYNVAAFSLPEGSRLRELLKRLPGVEVTSDGIILAQGRTVTALLLNGRDFFASQRTVVLDNLPAGVLLNVQVYDRESKDTEDMGFRATTEHVMDLTTETGKDRGWFADLTGAGGYDRRYSGNISLSQFNEEWQNMISASADNLPESFGIGDSFYEKIEKTLQTGDTHRRNFSVMLGRKRGAWETSGSAYYSGSNTQKGSRSLTETFLSRGSLFSSALSEGTDKSHSVTTDLHIERRDSLTTIAIDPRFSWSKSNGGSSYQMLSSDCQPNDVVTVPDMLRHFLHTGYSNSGDQTRMLSGQLSARLTRRLSRKGRTLTVAASYGIDDMNTRSSTFAFTNYVRAAYAEQQTRQSSQPDRDQQASLKLTWVEPLTKTLKLLGEYGLNHRHERMNQPVIADGSYCDSLSRYAVYNFFSRAARFLFQWSPSEHVFLNAGAQYNPVRMDTRYSRYHLKVDTVRNVTNWAPELNFYVRHPNGWNLSVQYSGHSRQPSLFALLPIVDDTDPLYQRTGNPGLKPSFTHQFSSVFFWFDTKSQTQLNLQAQALLEQNATTDVITFNPITGVRRVKPTNINGCRQVATSWTLTSAFKEQSHWDLEFQGDANIVRRVGVQQVEFEASDVIPDYYFSTRQTLVRQYLGLQWQAAWLSLKPYAYASYNRLRYFGGDGSPSDLWVIGEGLVCRVETPKGWSVGVDASRHSRRGFIEAVDNGDEWLVDAEVAFAFLKGKAAEVRLQACDLLRQRHLSRSSTTVTERIEAVYPYSVTNYILLSFTYRFALMGR